MNWKSLEIVGWYGLALAASQTCSRSGEDIERVFVVYNGFEFACLFKVELSRTWKLG
jgi:hypothetical protein